MLQLDVYGPMVDVLTNCCFKLASSGAPLAGVPFTNQPFGHKMVHLQKMNRQPPGATVIIKNGINRKPNVCIVVLDYIFLLSPSESSALGPSFGEALGDHDVWTNITAQMCLTAREGK